MRRPDTRPSARLTAALAAAGLIAVGLPTAALASPGDGAGGGEQVEAPVPELDWGPCEPTPDGPDVSAFECTTAVVPSDYDEPDGDTTEIALTRLPAADPEQRIGSLFLNFGGPGGPGVQTLHLLGPGFLAPEVVERFDIVGFDPRGVGQSDPVTCFPDAASENEFLTGIQAFPTTSREEVEQIAQYAVFSAACEALSGDRIEHASTANVARDMDLLRQAVGDDQLSYLGYSYGSVLGATYSALFPDRVRALAIDGTLDPELWSGGEGSIGTRIQQGPAAAETFEQFLAECATAGAERCSLAALGEPSVVVEDLFTALLDQPVEVPVPEGGTVEIGYDDAVAASFSSLYSPAAWGTLADTLAGLAALSGSVPAREVPRGIAASGGSLGELLRELGLIEDYPSAGGSLASMCVDGDHPLRPWDYPAQADAADTEAPHFGRFRSWVGIQCEFVQYRDDDAYTGPWEQQTDAPVLVIGTRYDPATPYWFTQPYADHFDDASVLTIEGYGHTSLGVSSCADAAIATYLVDLQAVDGATCDQDVAPFTDSVTPEDLEEQLALAPSIEGLTG